MFKNAIIVDVNGVKASETYVLVDSGTDVIFNRKLEDGESLIYNDISVALKMVKPCWNGTAWEETASPEEIAAAQPEPVEHRPSETEIIMLAVAELYEKYEKIQGGATV